jgi:hypothetical protein
MLKTVRVLNVIERIVADDFCEDLNCEAAFHPTELSQRERTANAKLSMIYRIVHSLNPSHSCYYVHKNWRAEFRKILAAEEPGEKDGKQP